MDNAALQGRVAVVSGASAGIGEAIARDLHAAGASVVVNARRAERLDALAESLGGDRVATAPGDAAEAKTVAGMLDTARDRFGREADLVVVNAGRGLRGGVHDSDESQWEEVIRTNLLGAAHLMRAAANRMVEALEGRDWTKAARDVVVIGSNVGRHISPFSSMYGSTKFAVGSLAEALRRDVGTKGVRVTLIEPGFVASEFQGVAGYDPSWFEGVVEKIGPVLEPADVARAVGFVVAQPPSVHINHLLIRPTRQDYP